MAAGSYKAKVPGSLMLFGEHAVLYGKHAIVAAINRHVTVTLKARKDNQVVIKTEHLGKHQTTLDKIKIVEPFEFVLAVIVEFADKLKSGVDLDISSDFGHDLGLGSSAAVTVATIAVLGKFVKAKISKQQLFVKAASIVQKLQGVSSGADVAASVFGGVILYKMKPLQIDAVAKELPLAVIYSGTKLKTKTVIEEVAKRFAMNKVDLDTLYQAIEHCVLHAVQAIRDEDYEMLGKLMDIHQDLQAVLGVSNGTLDNIIAELREMSEIFGAKISGAGMGDCVIGLGELTDKYFPMDELQHKLGVKQLTVHVEEEGIV